MRVLAVVPILCSAAALVLSFLCLFAGHKKGFMEDYDLLTLNTSRIGENLLNTSSLTSSTSSNPFSKIIANVTSTLSSHADDEIHAIAERLHIADFYSAHLLDYCQGSFTPATVPNATLSLHDIHRNVSGCSNATALYAFDPTAILQQALNSSGVSDVDLADLDWPQDIERGIKALHVVAVATFVLYCIAIALIGLTLLLGLPSLVAAGRLLPCLDALLALLAFLAVGLASTLVTVVAVKATDLINKYGKPVGVQADRGGKFLAITWAATALMLVAVVLWAVDVCAPRSRRRDYAYKHG